eukprot:466454-Pelagomonas_calceolata.AAC.2
MQRAYNFPGKSDWDQILQEVHTRVADQKTLVKICINTSGKLQQYFYLAGLAPFMARPLLSFLGPSLFQHQLTEEYSQQSSPWPSVTCMYI